MKLLGLLYGQTASKAVVASAINTFRSNFCRNLASYCTKFLIIKPALLTNPWHRLCFGKARPTLGLLAGTGTAGFSTRKTGLLQPVSRWVSFCCRISVFPSCWNIKLFQTLCKFSRFHVFERDVKFVSFQNHSEK